MLLLMLLALRMDVCCWQSGLQKADTCRPRACSVLVLPSVCVQCQGYNGSQLWDTSFALQAYTESGLASYFPRAMKLGYNYLEISQVLEDVKDREKFYRHISKGGWPFSTRDHGWPISDCTAEGLKATLALHETVVSDEKSQLISPQRCFDAVNVLLSFQNDDGGWATYENTRAPAWLELINPAEVTSFTNTRTRTPSRYLALPPPHTPTRTWCIGARMVWCTY